jgi:hypothetical protein
MARFAKGQSGNPNGRPKLTANAEAIREQIREAIPGVVARLIEASEGGDIGASKLLLERVLPALRPTDQPIQLPMPASPADAARTVLGAVSTGLVTPDEASKLMAGIGSLVRVIEVDELLKRIEALEARTHGDPIPAPTA